jgi:poly(A) polymerase
LIALHRALGNSAAADFCDHRLTEWPRSVLDPAPLVTGDDLKTLGLTPGPKFKAMLETVRREQLDGRLATRDAALALVETWTTNYTNQKK